MWTASNNITELEPWNTIMTLLNKSTDCYNLGLRIKIKAYFYIE